MNLTVNRSLFQPLTSHPPDTKSKLGCVKAQCDTGIESLSSEVISYVENKEGPALIPPPGME